MKNLKLTDKFYKAVGFALFAFMVACLVFATYYSIFINKDDYGYYKANDDFGYHWHVEGECYCE